MTTVSFRLDSKGIGEILKSSDMKKMTDEATIKMGEIVQSQVGDMEVIIDSYVTDRTAGAVVVADVRGMAAQAENGVLTRAAQQIGAEVTTK